jgi:molecular chaperone DnaK
MAAYNKKLATFDLTGLPPAPRGVPQIEVTFDIDANGIVHVSAKDLGTGKEQKMTITGGSALSKDEIEQMIRDAEAHADEDKQRRAEADIRNIGDSLLYQTEKFLKDNESKLNEVAFQNKKAELEKSLTELKQNLEGSDINAIKTATDNVNQLTQQITTDLYASANTNSNSPSSSEDESIEDAEVVNEQK